MGSFFWGNKNVLELEVAAQHCECTDTELFTLKWLTVLCDLNLNLEKVS